MGCINCKREISEQTVPYERKKNSRWRLIVGIEAKGIEFNAQVGLVHIGDERLEIQDLPQPEDRSTHQPEDRSTHQPEDRSTHQPEDRSLTES